jgi:hypothetical protein
MVEDAEMTTEEAVVDVSQDWVLACDVQQRFSTLAVLRVV